MGAAPNNKNKIMTNYKQRNFYQGGYYHIYNRGNNKQNVFLEEDDYLFYLKKLRKSKNKYNIGVLCYCLMPNHIHLILSQNTEVPISKFMLSLHTSYSLYFNRKYDKVGHLFQGRFGQKIIDKDEYLLQVSSYVHLNPIKDGLVERLDSYQWSSYPDYIGLREGTLCDKELVLYGATPEKYKKITEEQIKEQLIKEFQEKFLF